MENERNDEIGSPSTNDSHASRPIFSNDQPFDVGPKKQSGIGIASFVIALLSVVLLIVAIVSGSAFGDQIANSDLSIADPSDSAAFQASIEALGEDVLVSMMLAIISIFGAVGLSLVGLILGIVSAFSKNRRKVFGVIGIVLNVVVIIGALGLFFAGAAAIASSVA